MSGDRNKCEVTEIERMAGEMDRLFAEAEMRKTVTKKHTSILKAEALYTAGYCKRSAVIDEFVERLKEQPIKCGLPLFGLSTKDEIEEYFNGIMLQVRDAIDSIAEAMKGENK